MRLNVLLIGFLFLTSAFTAFIPVGEADVYTPMATEIRTIDDLWNIRHNPSGSYVLMNDLNFQNINHYASPNREAKMLENTTGDGWFPMGDGSSVPFTGSFNGNNNVIHNLYQDRLDGGLFWHARGAMFSNVGLVDVNIQNEHDGVGGFISFLERGMVTDVYVTGAIRSNDWNAGGLIGHLDGGVVSGCYADVDIVGDENVGGLIGKVLDGVVSNCFSSGSVVATGNGGGLIGLVLSEDFQQIQRVMLYMIVMPPEMYMEK